MRQLQFDEPPPPPKRKREDTGGPYIPPARLRMDITDNQRLAWESLKKSINGLVNKV